MKEKERIMRKAREDEVAAEVASLSHLLVRAIPRPSVLSLTAMCASASNPPPLHYLRYLGLLQ